jgi:predicted MFS family arabinose efflux permease
VKQAALTYSSDLHDQATAFQVTIVAIGFSASLVATSVTIAQYIITVRNLKRQRHRVFLALCLQPKK